MAISSAVATMTAQNYGAGLIQRMNKCLLSGIGFALIFLAYRSACIRNSCRKRSQHSSLKILRWWQWQQNIYGGYSIDCVVVSFVFCINSYFSGQGNSLFPMIHSLIATFLFSYSVILLVQPDRQFFTVYHGLRSTHFHSSFLIYMYLVSEIYTKKEITKTQFPYF